MHMRRKIDEFIQKDNLALKQEWTRVSFQDIREDDGYYYFSLCKVHPRDIGKLKNHIEWNWHFICRTEEGKWYNKPSYFQEVQEIVWTKFGETYEFPALSTSLLEDYVILEGICFQDYFYRIDWKNQVGTK